VSKPTPGPGDVLIKVAVAGICGTDIHIYHGEYEAVYPIIPGHEFSGVVAAVGDGVKWVRPGDRVTADPNIPCNRCPACQRNEPNQCFDHQAVGVTRDGAFAEYVVVPEEVVCPVGEMPFDVAAMVEPLACVVWGLKRIEVPPGASALVVGAGPMGCQVLQALKHAGAAQVVVTDVVPSRLTMAQELGASAAVLNDGNMPGLTEMAPYGFDLVVDATGIPQVLERAFEFVRPRGTVWVFGVCPPEERVSFVPFDVFRKDLRIVGSFAVNRTFTGAIALIQGGAVQVQPLISHQIPLDRFGEAIEIAQHDPGRMKVQLTVS
jgi:2-desacetyl-2-hydroxyethyl bacteriochlorophyllide A dehydrogenase